MPARDGLARVVELLEDAPFDYWLDSGSLLGLVRSGGVIAWDSDLDIGVRGSDRDAVARWMDEGCPASIRVKARRYRGRCYGYTLFDRFAKGTLPINLHFYEIESPWAWSPQLVNWPLLTELDREDRVINASATYRWLARLRKAGKQRSKGGPLRRAWRAGVCYPLWGVAVLFRDRFDRAEWPKVWPYSALYEAYTWVIPSRFFEAIERMEREDGLRVPVPADREEYLAHRYGDWRTPVRDWAYWLDDGCIRPAPPETVLPTLGLRRAVSPEVWAHAEREAGREG